MIQTYAILLPNPYLIKLQRTSYKCLGATSTQKKLCISLVTGRNVNFVLIFFFFLIIEPANFIFGTFALPQNEIMVLKMHLFFFIFFYQNFL